MIDVEALPTQRREDRNTRYGELTISASAFISEKSQELLRTSRILVAGLGSIGNPISTLLVKMGAENITVADPDKVERSNFPKQNYQEHQIGKNKAHMTALNLRFINFDASKTITSVKEGITPENVEELVRNSIIVVDAIDIRSLDMVWALHKYAHQYHKPVVVGYDLAGTAMIAVYRYDLKNIPILNNELNEKVVQEFISVKTAFKLGKLSESEFLNYVYSILTGPINPLKVPVEQLNEILDRHENETRTYQSGITSTALSSLAVETIIRILSGQEVKPVILVDIPTLVRKNNPSQIEKLTLLARVWLKIKQRGNSVKNTLSKLNQ